MFKLELHNTTIMVDNHIKRSLNLLHINECNQVDILVEEESGFSTTQPDGDDVPKEEYMETAGIPIRNEDLFTDCVVFVSDGHSNHLMIGGQHQSMNEFDAISKLSDDVVSSQKTILECPEANGNAFILEQTDPSSTNEQQQHIGLEQLKNVCRCCLSDERDLQSIYENDNCIADMIMAIATIQVIQCA